MKRFENSKLAKWIFGSELRLQVIRGGGTSLFIQVGFAALSFFTASLLGNFLGVDGYGVYSTAQSWILVLIPFCTLGFSSLLIRNISVYRSQNKWGDFKGILTFSNSLVLLLSIIGSIGVIIVSSITYKEPADLVIRYTIWIAAIQIPFLALTSLRHSATIGMEKIAKALLPDLTFRPVLILLAVTALFFFLPQYLTSQTAMICSVFAAIVAFIIGAFWLKNMIPEEVMRASPIYHAKLWLKTALPMMLNSWLNSIFSQSAFILLGLVLNTQAVGLYSAAFRIAYLMAFVPEAISIVLSPIIARLHANGENNKLQKILTNSVRLTILADVIIAVIFIFGSKLLLSLFGPEFISAKNTLLILVVGNLIDTSMGPTPTILNMTGHQKSVAVVFTIFTIINIGLSALLISELGHEGAALAYKASMILSRAVLLVITIKKLKLDPSII